MIVNLNNIEKIRMLISNGDTEKALNCYISLVKTTSNSKIIDEALLLTYQFSDFERRYNLGLERDTMERNRLVLCLLNNLSQIENEFIEIQDKDLNEAVFEILKFNRKLKFQRFFSISVVSILFILAIFISINILAAIILLILLAIIILNILDWVIVLYPSEFTLDNDSFDLDIHF